MRKKYHRTLKEVCEDHLWPDPGKPDPQKSWRHRAVAEVLRRIPESGYRRLRQLKAIGLLRWFVPTYGVQGAVICFDDEGGIPFKVIYLSPRLELAAWDIAVAVVAHELAHLVLDHQFGSTEREQEIYEEEVFRLLCEWGFEREAKKHEAVIKWKTSWYSR